MSNWMNTGMSRAEVEAATCNFTFRGGCYLGVCDDSRDFWRDNMHRVPLRLDEKITALFLNDNIPAFIQTAYARMYQKATTVQGKADVWKSLRSTQRWYGGLRSAGNAASRLVPEATLRLKALIIHASQLRDVGALKYAPRT
jgi:hypothetical protein